MLNQPFNPLPLDELTAVFARIKGLLLTEDKVDRALQLLVEALRDAVPGSTAAGISVFDALGNGRCTVAAGRSGKQAETAQHDLGQGPSVDAWSLGEPVLVLDAAADHRWPLWRQALTPIPIRAVVSSPLAAEGGRIGSLSLYAASPSAFTAATGDLLAKFAVPTATLLAHVQGPATQRHLSGPLRGALAGRDDANRACGILMERGGLTAEQAFHELMHRARTSGEPMASVCAGLTADGSTAGMGV